MQKVCIAVPGVRPLPHTELGRRQRAVELIRSGTSEAFATYLACSFTLPICCCALCCNACAVVCGLQCMHVWRSTSAVLPGLTVS